MSIAITGLAIASMVFAAFLLGIWVGRRRYVLGERRHG